jgi:hypothetical protein
MQCPADLATPCTLVGSNLFLLQSVSSDPTFATADPVPDGFTGSSLPVPHPAGSTGTLFLKLRDDPNPVNAATIAPAGPATQASAGHSHTPVRN